MHASKKKHQKYRIDRQKFLLNKNKNNFHFTYLFF